MVFLFMAVKLDVLSKCCLPFEVIKQPMLLNWSKKMMVLLAQNNQFKLNKKNCHQIYNAGVMPGRKKKPVLQTLHTHNYIFQVPPTGLFSNLLAYYS